MPNYLHMILCTHMLNPTKKRRKVCYELHISGVARNQTRVCMYSLLIRKDW